jgi:xylan 1,4-beta-xylosidase
MVFFWKYADNVLDFLISLNIHPVIDLTFMPSVLSSRETTAFWYRGNISKPKKLSEWQELVQQFAAHCLNRYGRKEVRTWYFEIWNEPDYMWVDTQEDYFDFYRATVHALHCVDQKIKIAGPSIMTPTEEKLPWVRNFIKDINDSKLPLDAFTYHIYGENGALVQNGVMVPQLGNKEFFTECIDHFKEYIDGLAVPVKEIFITEYNISAIHKNYLLDTMFPACHMLYDFLINHNKVDGIIPWTLSDIFEEDQELSGPFYGGFGMITVEGIKKPTWYAQWFLSKLGDEILMQSSEYIITRRGNDIQILAFSYVFYDELYRAGDRSLLKFDQRYGVFEYRDDLRLSFRLENMNGLYEKREYHLDREHGSAYDIYERMGCPAELSVEDVSFLKNMARPELKHSMISVGSGMTVEVDLPPHGISMVLLNKKLES